MESGSFIFGLIALACFIVPVLYYQAMKRKEKEKFIRYFLQLAGKQQLSLSAYDSWNDRYAIGIDEQRKQLFYLKKQEDKEFVLTIDLAKTDSCSLINAKRNIRESVVLDRIALSLSSLVPEQAEKELEFYLREESAAINDELKLAEKWKAHILKALPVKAQLSRDLATTIVPKKAA